MTNKQVVNELDLDESPRFKEKEKEIDLETAQIEKKVTNYTQWAWDLVWVGIFVLVGAVIYFLFTNNEPGFKLNLLGDFLSGSVASLWSLAGLLFIYVAFLGQKQQILNQQLELILSREELRNSRLELAGQRAEMREQNLTLKHQKFENTFFQLISLFNSIVNSLDLRNKKSKAITTAGRECFDVFYGRMIINLEKKVAMETMYDSKPKLLEDAVKESTIEQALEAYENLYNKSKSDLSHYYRTIYHIFKFIESSEIENKQQYASIARAQLSSYEQALLFYNCLHDHGKEKFKPLIEEFAVFKNIDDSLIINPKHYEEYHPSAYGSQN